MIAGLAACGLVMTYLLAVHTRAGQVLDTRAMLLTGRMLAGAHWTDALLTSITPTTVSLVIVLLGVLAFVAKGAAAAVAATLTAAGTVLAAIVLKALLDRPTLLDHAANSLPSGHVAAVAGVAAAVTLVTSPATRLFVALSGLTAVALTGVATLALRWHRPSDVIASVILAIGVAATTHLMATLRRAQAGCVRAAGEGHRVG